MYLVKHNIICNKFSKECEISTQQICTYHFIFSNIDADISAEGKEILHACADYLIEILCHMCSISHDPKQHVIGKLISIICDCRKQEFRGYFKELNAVFYKAMWPGAKLEDILFKVGP